MKRILKKAGILLLVFLLGSPFAACEVVVIIRPDDYLLRENR